MTRMLITGFEPFGGEAVNPSHDLGLLLAADPPEGMEVCYARLPVERYRTVDLALAHIERLRPDAVVMLGQAGGRMRITPERIAINVDHFRIPDNGGAQPQEDTHDSDGPAAYLCTLPVRAMAEAMVAAGIPAAVSNTAGTFLCNHLAYGVLHALAARRSPILAGFVHLPYLPEQAAVKPVEVASMSLDTMRSGLGAALVAVTAACRRPQPLGA